MPAHPGLIAAVCVGVVAATSWVLASSRLMRRRRRLGRSGVVRGRLMRWSGWVIVGAGVVFLGIPVLVVALAAAAATPLLGLVVIALISGRSRDR